MTSREYESGNKIDLIHLNTGETIIVYRGIQYIHVSVVEPGDDVESIIAEMIE